MKSVIAEEFKKHLSKVLPVDWCIDEVVSQLSSAFVCCDICIFEKYLTLGMDPNLILPGNYTPLTLLMSLATSGKWTEIAKLLLQRGASPNVKDPKGIPIVFSFISSGEVDLLSQSLSNGVDIETIGHEGESPILVAVHYRQVDCLRLLLENGANPNAADKDGNTAVMWAAGRSNGIGMQCSLICLKLLINHGANVNISNLKGFSPLMAASLIRELEAVKVIISAGANLESTDSKGESALIKAVYGNAEEIVKLLIQSGANVNASNTLESTPLMNASSLSVVEDLLLAGGAVDAIDCCGRTALFFQAEADRWELVGLLLEFGASLSVTNTTGETPLHIAFRRKSYKSISLLINAGAALDSFNNFGIGIIHEALLPLDYFNTINIFPKLNTSNLWRELVFYTAGYRNETHCFLKELLTLQTNIDAIADGDVTPLMIASGCGDVKAVKMLLSAGSNPMLMDSGERTALSYAVRSGQDEIVTVLLRAGCNPNIEDVNGFLPIYHAAFYKHQSIVLMLMLDFAFYYCYNKGLK